MAVCNLFYGADTPNYLIEYRGDFQEQIDKVSYACGRTITSIVAVVAVRDEDIERLKNDVPSILLFEFRTMYVLQDIDPSSVDNIVNIKLNPYLNLTGNGVVIGIIDSGIDYLNEEFIREDGTTRIEVLWDQSIQSNDENGPYIGKIYTKDDINNALNAKKENRDPYEIVPSKDTVGHGTKVAGIIGARGYNPQIQGVANNCTFAIVKLFESTNFKKTLSDNGINDVPAYNVSELYAGIEFLRNQFISLNKPMVLLVGIGSTEGSHDGNNLVSRYITSIGSLRGLCFIIGSGNEGASQGHASGFLAAENASKSVELRVPKEMKTLSIYIWIQRPNAASISIISPTGEASKVIEAKHNNSESIKFVFVDTDLKIQYYTPNHYTGDEVIHLMFSNIKPGIWIFELFGTYITNGRFDIWLPPQITLPEGTEFLEPDPTTTLTIPSAALNVITISYVSENSSIIPASGKGFNIDRRINPNVATIGVGILTTKPGGGITTFSGSSAATAIVAGGCALLMQWGIILGNDPAMYTRKINSYLYYGAKRNRNTEYPNRDVGYGEFDLLGTFNVISGIYRSIPDSGINPEYIEYNINNLFIRRPF